MEGLPPDSAYHRAMRGHDWSTLEYLVHSVDSRLRELLTFLGNLFRKEGASADKPKYLPTPDEGDVADAVVDEKTAAQQREEFDDVTARMFGG